MSSANFEHRRGMIRAIRVEQDKVVVELGALSVERGHAATAPDEQCYSAAFSADQIHELVTRLNQALLDLEQRQPSRETGSRRRSE